MQIKEMIFEMLHHAALTEQTPTAWQVGNEAWSVLRESVSDYLNVNPDNPHFMGLKVEIVHSLGYKVALKCGENFSGAISIAPEELHVMIDIETLGVGRSAPLFEIGAVVFDINSKRVLKRYFWRVDLLDVILQTGFVPQRDTVDWWRQQDYNPAEGEQRVNLASALRGLSSLYEEYTIRHTWGISPSFDMAILDEHYSAIGLPTPWTYREELDLRTMKWRHRDIGKRVVTHNALDDAEAQVEALFQYLQN